MPKPGKSPQKYYDGGKADRLTLHSLKRTGIKKYNNKANQGIGRAKPMERYQNAV
ncbi:MAG: hypothetical protein U9N85_03555 [Bacteroidota bacterium]|nr:hypothetical protein [Bacteroidota bacterium]